MTGAARAQVEYSSDSQLLDILRRGFVHLLSLGGHEPK